ncbi:DnaJ-domain-containing protein [Hypoxylon trugodes]|uniref:DnaJ-domain-containing protein n=1 Tax=Hypoxylon trugodes TaxID=326681 RepID=UPI00218F2D4B|nr:DnaJ-domain-containing protein [Hypoxylon trugodes]KAI1393118.1 DnaJ-domain-containing protein [Hypoxylon trugodes]
MGSFDEHNLSDFYADLQLTQQATSRDIKCAFRRLARKHHPDKKAPGQCIDAHEFRKVREAYECLIDEDRRAAYDRLYFDLRDEWNTQREQEERQRRDDERKQAEEEQRAAREKAEEKRRAAEAERVRRMEEERRAAEAKAERERIREEKARRAEERTREAARRAREQQELAAKERLRKEKEREAERRSEEAARRIRIEQELAAQERLKAILIEEKQQSARSSWAKMRQEADDRQAAKRRPARPMRSAPSPNCDHPRFGWLKKNGRSKCTFCNQTRTKWSFSCPECSVSACPGCKSNYCLF